MKILNVTFLKQPLLDIANDHSLSIVNKLKPLTLEFYFISVNEYYKLNIFSKKRVDSVNRKVGTGKLLNLILNELLQAGLIECNSEESQLNLTPDKYIFFDRNTSPINRGVVNG
ncbi:hypothetical protein [Companilactobacillus kedongensis]|uniref:hypothetical protein n=1 Tax=Companilactobacillus kedongensis TaxID=2486004 RepID=UPI000F77F034|nr:hypothetical protein [Companilactobacillus kedongensis]